MRLEISLAALVFLVYAIYIINCEQQLVSEQPIGRVEAVGPPKSFNFTEYVKKFHKNYGNSEVVSKAKLFYARTVQIFKHNLEYVGKNLGHFLVQNEFIDMTREEANELLVAHNSDLKPVAESALDPDMPAEEYHENVDILVRSKLQAKEKSYTKQSDTRSPSIKLKFNQDNNLKLTRVNKSALDKRNDPNMLTKAFNDRSYTDFSRKYAELIMGDFSDSLEPYPTPEIPIGKIFSPANTIGGYRPFNLAGLLSAVRDINPFSGAANELLVSPGEETQSESEADLEAAKVAAQKEPVLAVEPQQQEKGIKIGGHELHLDQVEILRHGPVRYDIDWRRTGCVPRAKAQKHCNACYVFATLDLMEYFHCQQTKKLIEFSTQYVIDCGYKVQLNGCNGGSFSRVGMFIKKYGIQKYSDYPYAGVQQECPIVGPNEEQLAREAAQLKPTIIKWTLHTDISAWYQWLPKTPLIVGINMPADFLAYGGGIHDGQDCVPGTLHAMVLVGSGIQGGKTFWLLKNTFSYAWGEGGYFRLAKRAPLKCFYSALEAKARF